MPKQKLEALSIEEFIRTSKKDYESWVLKETPWFRGQLEKQDNPISKKLLPKIYYEKHKRKENDLIQKFRMRAKNYGDVPEYSRSDEWLFLMQHCGLPTRLLDWTEGALIALFFAINRVQEKDQPVVWMLNPVILNILSLGICNFMLTWYGIKDDHPVKIPNLLAAFSNNKRIGTDVPTALYSQPVHKRVMTQKGCFTIHGNKKEGIEQILEEIDFEKNLFCLEKNNPTIISVIEQKCQLSYKEAKQKICNQYKKGSYLKKYEIACNHKNRQDYIKQLNSLGISYSILFPDLDGLAKELSQLHENA